jgi:hypothetical protein
MLKVVTLIQRKPGTTRAQFKDYYEKNHAPLGTRYFPFDKYVRNHLDSSVPADVPFDVYMEAFLDRTKALGLLSGDVAKVFDEDEKRFMNAPPRPEGFDANERLVSGPPRVVDPRGTPKTAFFVSNTGGAEPKAFFDAVAEWGKGLGRQVNATRVMLDEVIPGHNVTFFKSDAVLVLWTGHTFTATPKAPAGIHVDAMLALDSQETSKEDLAANFGKR